MPVDLKIEVGASIRCSNGVEVKISESYVKFHKPGERGGNGVAISFPLSQWDVVREGVEQVRVALRKADEAVAEIANAQTSIEDVIDA